MHSYTINSTTSLVQAVTLHTKHQISDLGRPRTMSRDLASAHGLISRLHLALQESLARAIIMLPFHFAFVSYLSHVTSNVARRHIITHDLASSRPSSIPLNQCRLASLRDCLQVASFSLAPQSVLFRYPFCRTAYHFRRPQDHFTSILSSSYRSLGFLNTFLHSLTLHIFSLPPFTFPFVLSVSLDLFSLTLPF